MLVKLENRVHLKRLQLNFIIVISPKQGPKSWIMGMGRSCLGTRAIPFTTDRLSLQRVQR